MASGILENTGDVERKRNPFFEISREFRALSVVYFLFWQILPTMLLATRSEAASDAVLGLTLAVDLLVTGFAMLPFLVKSFGGLPMGWLNPLALASILSVIKDTIRQPVHIIEPLAIWFRDPVPLQNELLTYWNLESIQWVDFKVSAMWALALIAYHFGFYIYRVRTRVRAPVITSAPTWYFIALYSALALAFFALIYLSGGLQSHFAELARGRFAVRESTGLLLVAVGFMPFLLVIWYLLNPRVLRMPIYWAMLVFALMLQFASDGSRSSVLIPLVVLAAGWMYRNRKVPAAAGVLGMGFAIIALATLGTIRSDARQEGNIDAAALSSLDLQQMLLRNDEEIAGRNWRSAPVAVAALVPREHDFLYGQTYIGAVLFWVPRSVWSEKPRGSGAHANAILFLKRRSAEGFEGASYPVSGPAEAYWNFGWFGILVIYALFGAFHKFVAERMMQRPRDVKYVTLLLLSVVTLNDVATDSLVPFLQLFVLLQLTFLGLRLIQPVKIGRSNLSFANEKQRA